MGKTLRMFVTLFFLAANISCALTEKGNIDSRTKTNMGKLGEFQKQNCGERRSKPGDPVDIYVDPFVDSRRLDLTVNYCLKSAIQDAKIRKFSVRLEITTGSEPNVGVLFATMAVHQPGDPQSVTLGTISNNTYIPPTISSKDTEQTTAHIFIEGDLITAEGTHVEFALFPELKFPIKSFRKIETK